MIGESYKLTLLILENNKQITKYRKLEQDQGLDFKEIIKGLNNSNQELIERLREVDYQETIYKESFK